MNTSPRAALENLIAAFERHYEACAARRGEDDPGVASATENLVAAFDTYDEALFEAFDEDTPFVIYEGDDEDLEEEYDDLVDEDLDDYDDLEDDDDYLGEGPPIDEDDGAVKR
ncbi:hypothetical protein [Devriesea agamarum]|uniref:hypothetical protein n=1 Tax=Devriesea agamarum TaxID=472569 RepID=UPI00071C4764|nr:hypothetical protein [Devriesea agamarum]